MKAKAETRIFLQLATLCLALFLLRVSYFALQTLQSRSQNTVGNNRMSLVYAIVGLLSLFVPTLAMEFISKNFNMCLSALFYIPFSLANLYPLPFTLTLTSAILGFGSNMCMIIVRLSISDLAEMHAKATGKCKDTITTKFFGILFASDALAMLLGKGVSSSVIDYTSTVNEGSHNLVDRAKLPNKTEAIVRNKSFSSYCDATGQDISTTTCQTDVTSVNVTTSFEISVGCIVIQLIAAVIMWSCTVDDTETLIAEDGERLINQKDNVDHNSTTLEEPTLRRVGRSIASTALLHVEDLGAILLIPYALHSGLVNGFFWSQFATDWMMCYLGIEHTGYAIATNTAGRVIGTSISAISCIVPRWLTVLINLLLETTSWATLTLRNPSPDDNNILINYMMIGVIGIAQSSGMVTATAIYTIFFRSQKAAALTAITAWSSIGKAIAYAISSYSCDSIFLVTFLLSFAGVGAALYFVTEYLYRKRITIE